MINTGGHVSPKTIMIIIIHIPDFEWAFFDSISSDGYLPPDIIGIPPYSSGFL
jgi:hypothetical protein